MEFEGKILFYFLPLLQWLNASIIASDNGVPSRSSTVELYIEVLDENDNDPIFDFGNSDYGLQIEVQENTQAGTVIANVKATDLDSGENGKITYFLDRRSASTGGGILSADIIDRFKIHPDTGELIVQDNLDREDQASYNLIVQAYDNYQFGEYNYTKLAKIISLGAFIRVIYIILNNCYNMFYF